jgi:hypothetical protein
MTKLISGKEAKLAWANGENVEFYSEDLDKWFSLNDDVFLSDVFDTRKLRLKPRTITLNNIEVPCNKSKHDKDDVVWVINTACENWYDWVYGSDCDSNTLYWETEDEIKQVVSALRSVFKMSI